MDTRVKVWGEGADGPLSYGKLVGYVTVYFVETEDGLRSLENAEEKPTNEQIAEMGGSQLCSIEDNPKIRLDSGEIVYGCQVWWEEI